MYSHDGLYHFYNQGINGQAIFRIEENYDFFLEKVKKHLLPNAHVLAYCLMYNHFHFLLRPTEFGASQSNKKVPVHGKNIENEMLPICNLSYGVQMLLSTYTRGFNKAYHRSGNLFRQGSNMKQCWDLRPLEDGGQGTIPDSSYPHTVFNYLHQNPVSAGICLDTVTWDWSSAREYQGPYDRGICDFEMAESLLRVRKFRG
ncbi:hypothetical protein [Neolewinella agarilytica]|uniref:hypothetical protein n=1 Tax=Neolewinella agarilytica TaxID=478744 RepID=UPI002357FC80|nr:hypothetical protein [Neolewinella agarilytica]